MSLLSYLRSTAVVLFLAWKIAAAPQGVAQPASRNSSSLLKVLDTPSTDIDTSMYQNSSIAAGFNDDVPDIICISGYIERKISVDSCRSTLNYLKQFPDFTYRQSFLLTVPREGRTITGTPNLPHIYNGVVMPDGPPFDIQTEDGDCAIKVVVDNPTGGSDYLIEGKFSWRDVRSTATRIIEHCDDPGQGGFRNIGFPDRPQGAPGWVVFAVGKDKPSSLGNGSVVDSGGTSAGVMTGQQTVPVNVD